MNITAILRRATGAALLLGLAAAPALAQAPDDFRIDDAWKAALEDTAGILTDKQQGVINSIAYAAAGALLCEGVDIDADKVAAATTTFTLGLTAATGLLVYAGQGRLELRAGSAAVLGALAGGLLGARLQTHVSPVTARRLTGVLLFVVAVVVAGRAVLA